MVSVPYMGYSFFNYIINRRVTRPRLIPVSVPYRGYSFFNGNQRGTVKRVGIDVSVPYRDYSFFN